VDSDRRCHSQRGGGRVVTSLASSGRSGKALEGSTGRRWRGNRGELSRENSREGHGMEVGRRGWPGRCAQQRAAALLVVWLCSKQQAVVCCLEEGAAKNREKRPTGWAKGYGPRKGKQTGPNQKR
jgi:hypothetical protein